MFVEERNRITLPRAIVLRAGWGEIRDARIIVAELRELGLVHLYSEEVGQEVLVEWGSAHATVAGPNFREVLEDSFRPLSLDKSRRVHLPPEILFHLEIHPDETTGRLTRQDGGHDPSFKRPALYLEARENGVSLLSLAFRETRRTRYFASAKAR